MKHDSNSGDSSKQQEGEGEGDLWLFGYGSLIWKQNFEFLSAHRTFVKGYQRVFYQGSTDHRGTPEKPGRVVTLIPDKSQLVAGVTFRVCASKRDEVLRQLDIREKGGYDRKYLVTYDYDSIDHSNAEAKAKTLQQGDETATTTGIIHSKTLCYIATTTNDEYLGPASVDEIAEQVVACRGPSGENREYVLNLEHGLRELGMLDDPHCLAVAEAVKTKLALVGGEGK